MFLPNLSGFAGTSPLHSSHSLNKWPGNDLTCTQTHRLAHMESSHTKAWFIYHKRWIPWNTCSNAHVRTLPHRHTPCYAHSRVAGPITSVTDGFSSSSDLNEYKYASLTSFICQRWTHLPRPAKRGSVALCSAGEGCIWEIQNWKGECQQGYRLLRSKHDPVASNKAWAKQ